jgi:hypothetical protein
LLLLILLFFNPTPAPLPTLLFGIFVHHSNFIKLRHYFSPRVLDEALLSLSYLSKATDRIQPFEHHFGNLQTKAFEAQEMRFTAQVLKSKAKTNTC